MDNEELPRLPDEIWEKIFNHLRGNESSKYLIKYRHVCKYWRKVIDKYFDFNVTVNDDKMDVASLSHLKVRCCIIKKFVVELPENHVDIFKDSDFLNKLFIWGPVSLENFQKLMTWATNVVELSITAEPMSTHGLISTAKEFNGFWEKMQKLTMDLSSSVRQTDANQRMIVPNLLDALGCNMPNLKLLSLSHDVYDLETAFKVRNYVLSFLGAHPNLVQLKLHMDFALRSKWRHELAGIPCPAVTDDVKQKLTEIKLASLTLSVSTYILRHWKPAIQLMRSIKTLRVTVIDGEKNNEGYLPEANLLNFLENRLVGIHSTLTIIEFSKVQINESVNAIYFRELKNLKRLVLRCSNQWHGGLGRSEILNLKMLPISIEVLCIHDIDIETEDLYLVAVQLENIRDVELINNGRMHAYGVSNKILARFAEKQNIQFMKIYPIISSSGDVIVRIDDNVVKDVNILNDKGGVSFDFNEFRKSALREVNV